MSFMIIFLLFGFLFACSSSVSGPRNQNDKSFTGDANADNQYPELCHPNPCQNDGQCYETSKGYRCICAVPFFGRNCEEDPCTERPCENDGTCLLSGYSFKCECRHPYRGDLCQEADLCSTDPCYNGGTCEIDGGSHKCKCRFPFTGKNCENERIGTSPDDEESSTNDYQWTANKTSEFPDIFNETTDPYQWTSNYSSESPEVFNATTSTYQWTSTYNDSSEFTEVFNDTTDNYKWTTYNPSNFTDDFNTTYTPSNFTNDFNTTYNPSNFTDDFQTTYDPSNFTDDFNTTYNPSNFTDDFQTTYDPSNFTVDFNTTYNPSNFTDDFQTTYDPSNFTDDFNTTYNPSNFTDDFDISIYEIKNFTETYNLTTIKPGICIEDKDCYNGGICRRGGNQFYCDCFPNFGGEKCERNILCDKLDSTCRAMGATCRIIGFNAICDCPFDKMYNPRSGICEDICDPWRCIYGKCEVMERTYKCNCDSGYTGHDCSERIKINPDIPNSWIFPVMTFLLSLICLLLIGIICNNCRNRK